MTWFKSPLPVCRHSGWWTYVSVRVLVDAISSQSVTEFSRVCRGCHLAQAGTWAGIWTREFLVSEVGQEADMDEVLADD